MGSHLLLLAPPPAHMIRKDPVLEAYQQEIAYVFHALRWLGARPQEIEDLAQEVFIALRRSWPHYDSSRPLRPYLFGVAFRVVSINDRGASSAQSPLSASVVPFTKPDKPSGLTVKRLRPKRVVGAR